MHLQEKTRAAAAPRKPKNGAVSSPLNVDDIFSAPIYDWLRLGIFLIAEFREEIWIRTRLMSLTDSVEISMKFHYGLDNRIIWGNFKLVLGLQWALKKSAYICI